MKLVGDFIKDITTALGIRQCGGCKRRQEKLNQMHRRIRGERPKGGKR